MRKYLLFALAFLILVGFSLQTASAQDRPFIAKEWLQVRPETFSSFKGSYDATSWLPRIEFTTNVDRPSGASYYVEFLQPNGAPWIKLDCKLGGVEWECKATDESEQQRITAVGVFPFAIKMKNPLDGTDKTLFTGKAKVEKAPLVAPELKKPPRLPTSRITTGRCPSATSSMKATGPASRSWFAEQIRRVWNYTCFIRGRR